MEEMRWLSYQLCALYGRVNKRENAGACKAKIVVMLEKLHGPNDPMLISTLQSQLHSPGRTEEVERIEVKE